MNWATIIVLLIIALLSFFAVKALRNGKSTCSCDNGAKKPENSGKCVGCTADCPFKR